MHCSMQSGDMPLRCSSKMLWRVKFQLLRWSRLIIGWVVGFHVGAGCVFNWPCSSCFIHISFCWCFIFFGSLLFLGWVWKYMSPLFSSLWIPWPAEGPAADWGPSQCPKQQCKHYLHLFVSNLVCVLFWCLLCVWCRGALLFIGQPIMEGRNAPLSS